MLDTSLCEELTRDLDNLFKARANVGEIRVFNTSEGLKKYQKQSNGTWKPLQKIKEGYQVRHDENYYGRNHSKYRKQPKEAVSFLSKEKKGQVKSVWIREDLGSIDLVYGTKNYGLAHIIDKHVGIEEKNGKKYVKDFETEEELGKEIERILKEGKIIRSYVDKKGYSKKDISLGRHKIVITESLIHDDDNITTKRWIVTSYDPTRDRKDKGIEKAVSNETASEKEPNCINSQQFLCDSRKNHLGEEQPSSVAYRPTTLSDCKSTLKKSLEQQFDEFLIQKARISYPIGTIKQFNVGGKMKDYIKTANGWRPKKKGGSLQSEKEVKQDMKEIREKAYWKPFSKEFSDKNEVVDWLYKEVYKMTKSKNEFGETLDLNQTKDLIKRFQKRYEFDSYIEAEKVLKGLSFNGTKEYSMAFDTNFGQYHFYIGKRQIEKNSNKEEQKEVSKENRSTPTIKQITQTYVKVEDGQIIIRMNKDKTRYKASKGSFKVESNEGEDIVQFKKRIKEEYEKQLKPKETELEKEIRESLEKRTVIDKIGELIKMGLSEVGLKDVVLKVYDRIRDNSFDKEKNKVLEIRQKREYKSYNEAEYNRIRDGRDLDNHLQNEVRDKLQDIPAEIKGTKGMYVDFALKRLERFYSNSDRENILSAYSGLSEEEKLSLDKRLIERGYQPIVNGLVYQNYEGNKSYKYFHKYEDALKFYKEDCSLSEEERKFYKEDWTRSGYKYINAVNTEKSIDLERSKELKINVLLDKINDEIKASKISKMIEKSSLNENLILTRYISLDRLNKEGQDLIFAKEGDVYEDLRFTAFGLSNDNELPITGDFKITLLAKKGQKVLNIGNEREVEYLCQRGSKFRVLKTGFSSIVVELLDE